MDWSRIAFRDAILLRDYHTVKEMLKNGFDVDIIIEDGRRNRNGIYFCAEEGFYKMAKLLLRNGCKLSIPCDYTLQTPLHMAVYVGDFDMVKLLLDNGADVTCKDVYERTAFHAACERNLLEIAKLLAIRNRSVIDMRDIYGCSPLWDACKYGSPELIQYVVEEGADVHMSDRRGYTPLLNVLKFNDRCTPNIVRFLVDLGADLSYRIRDEDSPLQVLIEEHSHKEEYRDVLLYVMELSDLSDRDNNGENILINILLFGELDLLKKFLNIGMSKDALSRKLFHGMKHSPYWIWQKLFWILRDIDFDHLIQFNIDAINLLLDIGVPSSSLLHFYPDSEEIRLLLQEYQSNPKPEPEWNLNDLIVLRKHVEQRCGEVRTLKSFCRDVVRGCLRMDKVTERLPQKMVKYLHYD